MVSKLRTNLNLCFTKIKGTISEPQSSIPMSPSSSSATPRNPNHDQTHIFSTTSSSSTSSTLMIKNYNSLYDHDYDHHHYYTSNNNHNNNSAASSSNSTLLPFHADEAAAATSIANFATAFASKRFFFSSPGCSNSILESTSSPESSIASSKSNNVLINNTVAVPTYSPDPYADFRKSMQEMMDSLEEEIKEKKSSWEFLHELLLCYLAANPTSNHKFILGAFADLVVSILPAWEDSGGHRQVADFSCVGSEISRQRMEG